MENNSAALNPLLAMMGLARSGVLNPQAVQTFLRNAQLLYKVGKDGQNKVQQQAKNEQQKPSSGGSGSGGEDPGDKDPKNPKKPDGNFKTPDPEHEHNFDKKKLPGKAQWNKLDGSVWEKDGTSHGGKQYKRWDNIHAWKKRQDPNSIWPDGRVRK